MLLDLEPQRRTDVDRAGPMAWKHGDVDREAADIHSLDLPGDARRATGRERRQIARPVRRPVLRIDIGARIAAQHVEMCDETAQRAGPRIANRRRESEVAAD